MPYAGDYYPRHSPGETKPYSMDLSLPLAGGDTIVSVTTDLAVAPAQPQGFSGSDPTPDAWLVGSPAFSGAICTQTVGGSMPSGLQPGVVYRLTFTATTASSRVLVNYGHILCGPLN